MTRRKRIALSERPDREAARDLRRAKLLEAAITVVRRDGPGASMDAIAAEAGITKPIIYRAFGDREGLTQAVADHFAAEIGAALSDAISQAPDDRTRVSNTIDAYVGFIERESAIVRFLIQRGIERSQQDAVALSGFVGNMGELLTQAIGEALRVRGLDSGAAEPWAYAIVGAVHLAGDWWLERRVISRERLVEYLTSLIWDGMEKFTAQPSGEGPGLVELRGRTG